MSAHAHAADHAPTLKPYVIGFVAAVLLTILPFGAVMAGSVSGATAVWLIMGAAAVQMVVHLVYFLHLDGSTDRWTLWALGFTVMVLAIILGGSLWVMYHLNHNMMMQMPLQG
ncbi:cytochrome o ubiquinol oxidase subunit IV [Sphingomonas morindae]|uniref:Cytochrome bo(3) ubiquinol oxidase subunit 4 n=1 Tax=Sphingomonas morindae TaxID=1541170 RepID=A0ABY4X7Y9_9SPHN|nr:cytochrome o ubiquinol oxidase subunit IV [Sphingomonas morindae]USI73058.1 cytochrome o ubiquinol oxidase subunit IV [Sphingomonas morindae]